MKINKFSALVVVLLLLSIAGADSESCFPLVVCAVCAVYLFFVALRDGWFYNPDRDEK